MSIINLDLDAKFAFDFKRRVIIAGKEYVISFNDKLDTTLKDLDLDVQGLAENLNKQSDKFEQEMTVDDRKQYIHQVNQQAQERILDSLDAIFGDGEGQRIYDYYDQSMYAMVRIVEVLRDTLAEINGEKRDNDAAKHQARKQSYTRKRRR